MRPRILITYIEEEKFSAGNYQKQMTYLKELQGSFEQVFTLEEENVWQLFTQIDARSSLCITTSPQIAEQMQGLGISVVGFEADTQEYMKAPYVVLGLDEITYEDLVKAYQRWHKIPWDIVTTPRLYIRELCLDDLDALQKMYEKPHLTDFVEPLFAREQERQYQKNYIEKIYGFYGFGIWLVFEKDTGQLIGRAGFEYRDFCEEGEVEMGYLIDPDYWRQGYASEAAKAIMEYAKNVMNMERILCRVDKQNTPSCSFLEKLGFLVRQEDEHQKMYAYDL